MKVVKVQGIMCPQCGDFVGAKDIRVGPNYQCGECGAVYEDRDEAEECCKE